MITCKKAIIRITVILFILINVLTVNAFAIVKQSKEFYVNDTANLISNDVEQYIIDTNKKLNSATGAQIVVVTIESLEGESLEEYAIKLFRQYGIGDKSKNNGVLLLLVLEERQFRIEVGYGLEGILNDAKTGRIQDDYIIPYLKDDNWDEGIRNGYSKILQIVSEEYGVDIGEITVNNVGESNVSFGFYTLPMLLFAFRGAFSKMKKSTKITILVIDAILMILTIVFKSFIVKIFIELIFSEFLIFIGALILLIYKGNIGRRYIFWRFRPFRRRILRRRFLWRRRIFWWRRSFQRFLNKMEI